MWPFTCKKCIELKKYIKEFEHKEDELNSFYLAEIKKLNAEVDDLQKLTLHFKSLSKAHWTLLRVELPPINTNILVANHDFSFFGFLYYEDGWDYSRKINMQYKDQVRATYTNPESITWWLNLSDIERPIPKSDYYTPSKIETLNELPNPIRVPLSVEKKSDKRRSTNNSRRIQNTSLSETN